MELESNNELEVDIVDDTPEADKGKPRRAEDARLELLAPLHLHGTGASRRCTLDLQSTQKLKAILANPTIRRFLIHYFVF